MYIQCTVHIVAATVICERKKSQMFGLSGSNLESPTITKKNNPQLLCTVCGLFECGGQFYYDMSVN